jgi:hypothetical protein
MKKFYPIMILALLVMASVPTLAMSGSKTPWELVLNADVYAQTGLTDYAGAEYDGTYFYVSLGASSNLVQQYDREGVFVKNITIPGVAGIQDLAYDGTYFYGGAVDNVIYQMDFASETLVGTIPSPILVSGIAYNPDLDAFYVSWWSWEVDLIARDGTVLQTIDMENPANARFGLAYDNVSPGGPFLWVFDQGLTSQYERARIYQWNLQTNNFTGVYHDVGADIGSGWGIAKGLFTTMDYISGDYCIGGIIADGGCPPKQRYYGDYLFVYELISSNEPPETPTPPDGPESGILGIQYPFTAVTNDPEGDNISYKFDWGDENISGWLGPYSSGSPATGQHAWNALGDFTVRVKAKDTNGAESDWSEPHVISITNAPIIEIGTITGGLLRVKTTIKNTGATPATNVAWTIQLSGLILTGKESSGTIDTLAPGTSVDIASKPIIGFGKTSITITAGQTNTTQNALVLLVYIKV